MRNITIYLALSLCLLASKLVAQEQTNPTFESKAKAIAEKITSITNEESLDYDFVGLNRGSSLLELTSRCAEKLGKQMRLRIQVRSYDAMCQMIAVNLGIGVLPFQACEAQLKAMGLKAIPLEDSWAARNLILATKANTNQ